MSDIKERLHCCLTEKKQDSNVSNIFHEFKLYEIYKVIELLLNEYDDQKYLLEKFWNDKSDNCPIESELQESQILNFREFVKKLRNE